MSTVDSRMGADVTGGVGREPPAARESEIRHPLRVLLVEDNEDDAAIILRLLRRGGYEPEWARVQTADALDRALSEGSWDVVLSDYTMPQFDALRALHALREQSPFLPFIVISGSIGEETAVAAMRAGASDYLMKSNLTRLVPAIERELREASERRERARTKKALLDLQEKFQAIFREYLDVMLVLDAANGNVVHVNRAVTQTMGYDERWLSGQPFALLWPADQQGIPAAILERVRRDGSAFYSGNFLRLDGSACPMDLQASKVPWGRSEAIIVTLRDVSERHRAEERLSSEKEQLAVTLRSIGEAVITTDTRGRISLLNGVAEESTGWRQIEAAGRPLADVLRLRVGPDNAPAPDPAAEVMRTGAIVEIAKHLVLHSRDGRTCALVLTAAPIRSHDGRVTGAVMVFRDITNDQKLEEELQKASRLESVALLAGGIAHDFNNILTAIMGHISLAKASATPSPHVITTIERACIYATDLTRQLLAFAKGSAPNRRVESIAEVVREAVEFALHGSNLRCELDFAPDLDPVEIDRGQISQVINNLVINAIQATADSGGILRVQAHNVLVDRERPIATLEDGAYVCFSIRDQGTGISPEHLSRIFDPYFTTKPGGSGLGLATAYSIIKKHDGLIQAESQAGNQAGNGTAFYIYLPSRGVGARGVMGDLPAATGAPHPTGRVNGRSRILFMDDEDILQELVSAMLEYLGYDVECAADGEAAVRAFIRARAVGTPFDAVIVDLTIPGGMGGQEAVQRMRAIEPGMKAVVSSGYSNDPVLANFESHGFTGAIAKPYQIEELAKVLEAVLSC